MRGRCGPAVLALIAVLAAPPAQADHADSLGALLDAAAERLQVADPVAAYKWATHGAIEDPDRVEREIATLREEAAAQDVDPDFVARVFGDQISATEAVEYTRFAEWKLDPTGVPPAPPDLAASRAAIDALNTKILSHISLNWSLLNTADCGRLVQRARAETSRRRSFDDLYQRALTTATRSYCPASRGA